MRPSPSCLTSTRSRCRRMRWCCRWTSKPPCSHALMGFRPGPPNRQTCPTGMSMYTSAGALHVFAAFDTRAARCMAHVMPASGHRNASRFWSTWPGAVPAHIRTNNSSASSNGSACASPILLLTTTYKPSLRSSFGHGISRRIRSTGRHSLWPRPRQARPPWSHDLGYIRVTTYT
jgi:hypothetical protein